MKSAFPTLRLAGWLCCLALASCEPPPILPTAEESLPREKIKVVTTTTQLAQLAREIGGKAVIVECLLTVNLPLAPTAVEGEKTTPPPWTPDPFHWTPRASDLFSIRTAHVVVINGLGLEKSLEAQLPALQEAGVEAVAVGDAIPEAERLTLPGPNPVPDPCIWNSPRLWKVAADVICTALKSKVRPEAEPYFTQRANAVTVRMDRLAEWAEERLASTHPKGQRYLFTSHQTLGYFARDFGIETHALLLPNGEPLPDAEQDLVLWLANHNVSHFVPDVQAPNELLTHTQNFWTSTIGKRVYTLFLARPGTLQSGLLEVNDVGTYDGAFTHLVRAMERRLGGTKSLIPDKP